MTKTILALCLAVILAPMAARAQGFTLAQGGNEQIQVYADDGIEWISNATRVVAHGNARAVRGNVTVTADTLTAYYREGGEGNQIWRLDADGAVTIRTPTETATGVKAIYDLDKAIFVLRGEPARLVTPTDTVIAHDALEYWENDRMAVARGDAVASQNGHQVRADVLTSHFKDGPKGALVMRRADGFGHVEMTSPTETVTGDRGDYNLETGIATVTGSVKITRDGNVMNGGYAHVNMNTGISKLFGDTPGGAKGGSGRVTGTFTPEGKEGDAKGGVFKGAGAKAKADGAGQTGNGNGSN